MRQGFKYDLGGALLLVTSVPLLHEQMQMEKEEAADKAERDALPPRDDDEVAAFISGRFTIGIIEQGEVIGRAEYLNAEPSYLMRYRDGSGRQVEEFIPESGLTTWDEAEEAFESAQRVQAEQAAAAGGGAAAAPAADEE